jgi:hypothetical protein
MGKRPNLERELTNKGDVHWVNGGLRTHPASEEINGKMKRFSLILGTDPNGGRRDEDDGELTLGSSFE